MKTFKRFPSIEQFRSVVKQVKDTSSYVGQDGEGKPIFDYTRPLPTITFTGTVKLHGTNAAIGYSKQDGLWCHWCGVECNPAQSPNCDTYPTEEHLVRKADGGRRTMENIVVACKKCNNTRHK